jgi:predicted amidohydrolase YtcJ
VFAGRVATPTPGKLADLIVLDRNVMQIPATDIENTNVQLT